MSSIKHWGEIDPIDDEERKEIDGEALEEMLTQLSIGRPMKLHQPYSSEDGSLKEVPQECSRMDKNVIESIKLLERIRNHYGISSKSSSVNYGQGSSDRSSINHGQESDRAFLNQEEPMEDDEAEREKMYKFKIRENFMDFDQEFNSFGKASTPPPDLHAHAARKILQKSVAALIAQVGYDTSLQSSLETLTDVAHFFMRHFTRLLRIAVDRETESGPHGFPDAVEWTFYESGFGSMTSLHQYYQEQVLNHRAYLQATVNKLPPPPRVPPPAQAIPSEQMEQGEDEPIRVTIKEEVQDDEDDIPEIHFPALGNGEASEEMQSTLEPGFQMLHNLEEGALG